MGENAECGGYNYEIQIIRSGTVLFKAQFSVITDIASLALFSVINMIKLLYPDAEVKSIVCKDAPVFAVPLFENVMRAYMSSQLTGNKFG